MPDEVIIQEPVKVEPTPFANNAWTETFPEVKKEETTETAQTSSTATTSAAPENKDIEEILDPKDWLKREFQVDDPEVLRQQIKEYRELKEKQQTELKFENDESKNLHELFRTGKGKEAIKIMEKQEKIEAYSALEVNDDTAADIIKLNLQLKYPTLTQKQIDFQYNQEYGIPKEPVFDKLKDDEDEFNEKHDAWKEQVANVKMKSTIAATMAKPELEAAKVKLVLPEIDKPTAQANEPTAEEIEKQKKWAENFLNTVNSNYSKVEGFETKVKDELVEYPVSFKIPDEDKVAIKERLIKGVDVNELMGKRWFSEQGEANVEQMSKDLYVLENLDKILSGVANKSASQRLIEFRKSASNINLNGNSNQETFHPEQNGVNKVSPFGKDAWSEKPPSSLNN